MQNILVLKIVDQIWPEMFSYKLNKLFLDTSRSGYSTTKGLIPTEKMLVVSK